MRNRGVAVLMTMLLLLCGCSRNKGEGDLQKAIDFRAALLSAPSCSYLAQVTADYGDVSYEFTMQCNGDDETTEITVTAPESISGITAEISGEDGTVTFQGMALDFGAMADGSVTPIAAPSVLERCWRSAYIASAGKEDDSLRVQYEYGDEARQLVADTWFSQEKNIPIYAEICYNENCILKITISDFQMQG